MSNLSFLHHSLFVILFVHSLITFRHRGSCSMIQYSKEIFKAVSRNNRNALNNEFKERLANEKRGNSV